MWLVIHRACEANAEDAQALLDAHNLIASNGSLTLCYDQRRYPYRVPIACINDPRSYLKSDVEKRKEMAIPDEIIIPEIRIRVPGKEDFTFSRVSSHLSIDELKSMMDEQLGGGNKIRLFFSGRELKEGLSIYHYEITSDVTIACMAHKKPA